MTNKKILLIDVETSASDVLTKTGFNVKAGTFGQPYKVQMDSTFQQLISKPLLPNFTEQEIVIIDLQYEVANRHVGEKERPEGELDLWGKCDCGFIDPRMRAAGQVQSDFDKILEAGGVFVVFAANRTPGLIQVAKLGYRGFENAERCSWSEWSFISELHDMKVSPSHGEEMNVVDQNTLLGKLIISHLSGSLYDCTLEGGYRSANPWTTLVKNKFGDSVGSMPFSVELDITGNGG